MPKIIRGNREEQEEFLKLKQHFDKMNGRGKSNAQRTLSRQKTPRRKEKRYEENEKKSEMREINTENP